MMNKLGFKITRTNNGLVDICTCNGGEWEKSVIDVRDYLDCFNGIEEADKFLTFLSFDYNGCFLAQLKRISDRGGDNLCGWIYIPNTIEITGAEINTAYNFVHDVLLMSDITGYKEKIDSFFSKQYDAKRVPISYTPSSKEDKYGFIKENVSPSFCSLEDFFKYRYQPEYSQYKAVFFLNSNDSIVEEHDKLFTDLTNLKFKELCVLLDFPEADKKRLHIDKIVDEKGQEVHFPKVYAKDERVKLYAIRRGFEPKGLDITVDEENKRLFTDRISWVKKITSDIFVVNGKDGKPINGLATIRVNKKDITNRPEYFEECDLENVPVIVSAKGYEEYSVKHNLLSESKPILIQMHRKEKSFDCKIKLVNGGSANMSLKSKDLAGFRTDESPLEGYNNDRGTLRISSSYKWKQRLYGFLFSVFLVVCYLGYFWYESGSSTFSDDTQQEDTTYTQVEDKPFTDQAIAYMDKNKIWNKDSLILYTGTDSLYNSINEYNFEYLVGLDASGSKSLNEVVNCARDMFDNKQNVKGKFSEDGKITISKWIDKMSKKLAESTADDKSVEEKKAEDAQNKSTDKNAKDRKEQANSKSKSEEQVKSKQAKGKEQAKEQQKASKGQNTKDAKGTKGEKSAKKVPSDNQPASGTNKLGR